MLGTFACTVFTAWLCSDHTLGLEHLSPSSWTIHLPFRVTSSRKPSLIFWQGQGFFWLSQSLGFPALGCARPVWSFPCNLSALPHAVSPKGAVIS